MTKHFDSIEEAEKEFDDEFPIDSQFFCCKGPNCDSKECDGKVRIGLKSLLHLIWQSATKVENERIIKVVEKLKSGLTMKWDNHKEQSWAYDKVLDSLNTTIIEEITRHD